MNEDETLVEEDDIDEGAQAMPAPEELPEVPPVGEERAAAFPKLGGGNVFDALADEPAEEETDVELPGIDEDRARMFPLIGAHSVFEPLDMELAIANRHLTTGDPEQAAVVDALARRFDSPRAAVEATLEETRSRAIREDNERRLAQAPSFLRWFNENPKQAPILAKDLDKLTVTDRALSGIRAGENVRQNPLDDARQVAVDIQDGAKVGWLNTERGYYGNAAMEGRTPIDAELLARRDALDEEIQSAQAHTKNGVAYETANLVAGMVGMARHGLTSLKGGAFGAFLGGMTVAAAPEAALGGGLLAAGGAAAGAVPALTIVGGAALGAMLEGTYIVESGNSFLDQLQEGVDPEVARWTSAGAGALNAVIEAVGDTLTAGAFAPIARKMADQFTKKAANKLMQEGAWQAVREYALASGKSVMSETFTEVLQEVVGMSAEELGRIWSETGKDPIKVEEFWDRLSDIAIATMKGTVGMAALGVPFRAVAFSRARANAEQVKARLGEVLKATGEMKAKESSPETVKEAVNSAAEQKNVGEVYVDGQEFRQILFQNNITKEELEQVAPGLWGQVEEQADNGGDVVMKTGDFMVSLSGTKIAPQLLDHVRAHQEDLSAAETRAVRKEALNELKRAREAVEKGEMPDEEVVQARKGSLSKEHRDVIDRVEKRTLEALKSAGMSEKDAKANARYQVLLLSNFARQTGIDAATLEAWAPSIQSPAAQRLLAERERTARALRGANGVELAPGLQETTLDDGRVFLTYEGIADLGMLPETIENRKPVRVEGGTLTAERLGRELESLENAGYGLIQAVWEITQKADAVYSRPDGTLFIAKNIYTQRDGKFVHGILMADLEDAGDYYRVSGLRATDNAEVLQGAERLALDESAVDPAELIGTETGIPTIGGNGELRQIRSTSLPTRKGFPDPYLEPVFQSYEVLKRFPETLANRVAFFLKPRAKPEDAANYAGIKGAVGDAKDPRIQAERIINRLVENLLYLYNLVPEEYKQRARLWYDGGRRAVMTWARRYKLRPRQTAGVIAVFSPQMDWFKNMSLAERLMDIYFSAMDVRVTPEMEAWIENRAPKGAFTPGRTVDDYLGYKFSGRTLREMIDEARGKARAQAKLQDEAVARARAEARALAEADVQKRSAAEARGKKLKSKPKDEEELFAKCLKNELKEIGNKKGELITEEMLFVKLLEGAPAQFIKAYNGAYFSPNYYILKPEGGSTMKSPLTQQGIPEKMNFGPANPIAKGLSILVDGSVKNIGQQIGGEFKVRNFYNNLYAPWYSRTVTIDTHAVAAALLAPMTGSTRAVTDNFGGGTEEDIGQQGAYPIYAEAYRRAAAMVGLLPREMQSITWEAVRVLFEAEGKAALRPKVAAIWQEHDEGKITAQEARERIFKEAGGFRKLSWQDEPFGQDLDSTYDRSKVQGLIGAQAAPMEPTITFGPGPGPDLSTPLGQVWASLTPERRERAAFYAREAALSQIAKEIGAPIGESYRRFAARDGERADRFAVQLEAGTPVQRAAQLIARVFGQDAVRVLSGAQEEGLAPRRGLRLDVPWAAEDDARQNAWENVIRQAGGGDTLADEWGLSSLLDDESAEGVLARAGELVSSLGEGFGVSQADLFAGDFGPAPDEIPGTAEVVKRAQDAYNAALAREAERERGEQDLYERYQSDQRGDKDVLLQIEPPLPDSGGQALKQINIRPEQLPPDVAPQDRLVVLHETTIEKLLKSLKLGGLPLPSLGITKWLQPYDDFGDIALIGTAGMIDPASGTDVYSADAYTGRFPKVIYETDAGKAQEIADHINKLTSPYGFTVSGPYLAANALPDDGMGGLWGSSQGIGAVWLAYLIESGEDVAPVKFESRGGESHAPALFRDDKIRALCEELGPDKDPEYDRYLALRKELDRAIKEKGDKAWDGASEFARKYWELQVHGPMKARVDDFCALVLGLEGRVHRDPARVSDVLTKAKRKILMSRAEHQEGIKQWARRLAEGLIKDPQIRLHGKLVPMTLENVVEAMLARKGRNREQGMQGLSNNELIAAGAKKFRSSDEIKASRQQVQNDEASAEAKQVVDDAIDDFVEAANYKSSARVALKRVAKLKRPTEKSLRAALEKEGIEPTDELMRLGMEALKEIKNAVTMYFEAKPPRAVGFDEFVGAVVPEDTPEEIVQALKGYGLEIEVYGWQQDAFDRAVKSLSSRLQEKRGDVLFQKARQGDEDIAGSYNPKTNTLRLTANANPSTFAHEMGHWFLEQSCAAARLTTCSKSFVADLEAMLRSMGIDGLAGWEAADWATRERIHERWAAHVETYLAEGRAPNAESKPFLRRLAQVIRDFYRAWKNGTDTATRARYRQQFGEEMPDLSPEVRRMLDRMIAGEDAALEAERKLGLSALYEGKEKPEDVSDEVWRELQETHDDTLAEAIEDYLAKAEKDEKWYDSKRGRMLRENDERAKKLREEVREEVRVAVNSRRDYTAIDLIKKPGNPLTGNNLKLSPEDIKALGYSPRQIKKLRDLGLVREGGVPVSVAREFLRPFAKFNSDRQLIESLLSAGDREKRIEAETTRECLRRYSEVFDQKEVEQRITDALHSEHQARRIMLEARLLIEQRDKAAKDERKKAAKEQRAQQREHEAELRKSVRAEREKAAAERRELRDELRKSTSASRVMLAAAKEAAKRLVQDMPFNRVTLRHFLALEAKAGRKALRAVREGKVEAALEAKKQQMVFHEAARLAFQAEHDVERLKRIKSRIFQNDKKLSGSYDVRILAVARAILTNHGFGVKEKKETVPAEKWLERVRAYDPDIAKGLEEILKRHPPQAETETLGEFRELMADVRALMKMAADARNSTLNGRKVNIEQAVEELVAKLSSLPQEGMPAQHRAATKGERRHRLLLTAKAYLTRVESWCRIMDGGAPGAFTQYIFRPIAEVASRFRVQNVEYQKKLRDILKERIKAWDKVRDIEVPELKYTFGRKSELIGMLLHIGNPSNYRKLVLGGTGPDNRWASITVDENDVEHMNDGAFQNFLERIMRDGTLTKDDMDAIQQIWDLMEEMKPQMQKAFQAYYGYYFEEIQAKEIMTPWGAYRGGYVPAYTDAMRVSEASKQREQDLMAEADVSDVMPVRRPGSTIRRKERYTKPLNFNIGMLQGHMAKVLRFAVMAPTVKTVQRIIKDRQFAEALDGVDPTIISDMLLPWLSRAATQSVTTPAGPFGAMLNKLRSTAGMSIMAAHLANAIQQLTGFSVAIPLIGPGRLAVALRERALHPKQTFERVLEASDFMRARLDDMGFEYAAEIQEMAALEVPTSREKIKQWAVRNAYFFQTVLQKWVDVPVWMAAYDKAVEEGMEHADAVAEADSVVRRTQSSFDPESVARVETGHPAVRAFLVFYNYFNMQLNLTRERAALAADTKRYGRFLADVHLIVLIPAVLSELIMQSFTGFDTGDDDDWDALDALALFVGAPFRNFLALVPIVGQTINTLGARAAKKKDDIGEVARFLFGNSYNERLVSIPAASIIENSIDGALDAMRYVAGEEVKERRMVRNLCDLLTVLTGAPVSALKRPVGYLTGVASGEYQPESGLDVARGLVAGREPDR